MRTTSPRLAQWNPAPERKRKPWRNCWPDEVLARPLKMDAERAEQERLVGLATVAVVPAKTKKSRGKKSDATSAQGDLILPPQEDLFT